MTLNCAWHHGPATRSQWPGGQMLVTVFCLLLVVVNSVRHKFC